MDMEIKLCKLVRAISLRVKLFHRNTLCNSTKLYSSKLEVTSLCKRKRIVFYTMRNTFPIKAF